MVSLRLALPLLASLLLAACAPKREPPLAAAAPASITGHVRVLDADALIVDGRHVRLANAYGPESLLQARCWAEALASDHAAQFVRDLVDHARAYEFRPNGETDEFSRTVGFMLIDGADLGDLLYAQGLAARPSVPRFDWCAPISQQAQGAPKISSLYAPE
jgi:endonuclease YncB( thermonuclease family)